jgi:NAD(P)-dependent dehydrogenase (short-subunit alcohol dehydrogenase family)
LDNGTQVYVMHSATEDIGSGLCRDLAGKGAKLAVGARARSG